MKAIRSLQPEQTVPGASNVTSDHGISVLHNNSYVMVWGEKNGGIKAQIFNSNGKAKAGSFDVSLSTNDENRPDVTTLKDGSFVVTYTSLESLTNAAVNAQRFAADGTRIGNELTVFHDPDDTSFDPEITALNDGGYVVVYNGFGRDGSYYSYHARVFNADGTPRSNDFRVNQTTESFQSFGDVISLSDGGFAVTWRSKNVDGSSYAVMLRLYDPNGTPRTDELRVNQYSLNNQSDATITTLENGKLLLAWNSDGQDGSDKGVYARIMNPDGSPAGNEFRVNTQTLEIQYNPEVTALSDGGFVVVWVDVPSSDTMSVMAQRFAADGARLGGEIKLSEGSQDLHIRPKVTELSDGVISVSWQSYDRANFQGQLESKLLLTPDLGSDGNDILTGTRYDDRLDALAGNDKLLGQGGNDRLKGGVGNDILKGQSGADHLSGGAGQDRLFGGEKADQLLGGKGADALFGGGGKDTLNGNTGNDVMVGGAGVDTFVFSKGRDTISDFDGDVLKLDDGLWQNNNLSITQIMQFAQVSNGDLVFDFANGNTLTLTGYTDTGALEDAIIIF